MSYFDPAATKDPELTNIPTTAVSVEVQQGQPLKTIPSNFYGLNIHPGSAKYEIAANPVLLKALKPDAIRVMTRHRTDWLPNATGVKIYLLAPSQNTYDWTELDNLVKSIVDLGAEPYLTLGFGPPHWINGSTSLTARKPPPAARVAEYADYMAAIVKRYADQKNLRLRSVSVENEPENVGYPVDVYMQLAREAQARIRQAAPGIKIGGPSTGYALWGQPDKSTLSFSQSTAMMHGANLPFDFFDWHVYSTSAETILRTVRYVKSLYGNSFPLVISELNRDWRYSGAEAAISKLNNTSWGSVSWMAYVYDNLQTLGVSQVFYFAWRENNLGLVDSKLEEARPNYFLLRAFTQNLGRFRVKTISSSPVIGAIATTDNGLQMLVYNRVSLDVKVKLAGLQAGVFYTSTYDKDWVANNKRIPAGGVPGEPPAVLHDSAATITIPAGGFVLVHTSNSPPNPPTPTLTVKP
jgi:hypothetical protein